MRITRIGALAGLLGLGLALTAAPSDAFGRRGGGPHGGGPQGPPPLAEVLDLTEDQQAELEQLRQSHRQQARQLRADGADGDAFQALRQTHHEQVEAILTETQRARLEALHAERRARLEARRETRDGCGWRCGGPGRDGAPGAPRLGRGGPPADHPMAALELSEAQQTQLDALRDELRSQLQALRGSGDRDAARALLQAHREQVEQLLTEQQQAQLEALRAERPHRRPRGFGPPPAAAPDGDAAGEQDDGATKAAGSDGPAARSWGTIKTDPR